jgi:hypothetical protein
LCVLATAFCRPVVIHLTMLRATSRQAFPLSQLTAERAEKATEVRGEHAPLSLIRRALAKFGGNGLSAIHGEKRFAVCSPCCKGMITNTLGDDSFRTMRLLRP